MRVLGIDPGPEKSAYAVLLDGKIESFGIVPSEEICRTIAGLRREGAFIDLVACECIVGQNNRVGSDVFETCRYEGKIEAHCQSGAYDFRRVRRVDVRIYLCNSIRAGDPDVRAELVHRFGAPGTKKEPGATYGMAKDMWAALGVAVYAQDVPQDPQKAWDGGPA